MEDYNLYLADIHHGNLPVRVLAPKAISWFKKIGPNIIEQIEHEIEAEGMNPEIKIVIDNMPIQEVPYLSEDRTLVIHESYCQYLWNIFYALLILFSEGRVKPSLLKQQNAKIEYDILSVEKGVMSFVLGIRLFEERNDTLIYSLPNPERFNKDDQFYIEIANSAYIAALTWVLYHEFGHQYLGHLNYHPTDGQAKLDELDADDYATEMLVQSNYIEYQFGLKVGIIAALGSLVLSDSTLHGGKDHPDPDIRFERAVLMMELSADDEIWGLAAHLLHMWLIHNKFTLQLDKELDTHKDLFDITLAQIRNMKA